VEPLSFVDSLRDLLLVVGIVIVAALIGAVALLIMAARQIADLDIPPDADFFETMQHVPITVPLALDLLDMAFDIFAAPIAWVILEMLGLQALQLITVFEGLIPGTQLIPTLTAAWVISRMMKDKRRTPMRNALHEYQLESQRSRYDQLRGGRASAGDRYRRLVLPESSGSDVVEGEYYEDGEDGDEYFEEDWGEEPPPDYYEEGEW
jgi:hypothetical protein